MKETEIDITLIAGRRPELLRRTLASFQRKCFANFRIANVFVNIDPFCGQAEDARVCEDIVRDHFASADVTRPVSASYSEAVKRVWSKIRSPYALHLEDDWLLLESITPDRIFPIFEGKTRMVLLMAHEHKRSRDTKFNWTRRRIPYTPFRINEHPCFSVSPSFVCGSFAREYADLIDTNFDPEKQSRGRGGG